MMSETELAALLENAVSAIAGEQNAAGYKQKYYLALAKTIISYIKSKAEVTVTSGAGAGGKGTIS